MKQTHILGFEIIEIHRCFDGFAASSVRCLNEVSSQRELADKRSVKTPSMDFVFRTLIYVSVSFYTRRTTVFSNKNLTPVIRLILQSNILSLKHRILPIFLLLLIIRKCIKCRIRQDQDHRNINERHNSHQHI